MTNWTKPTGSFPNRAGNHADTDDLLNAELKAAGIHNSLARDGYDTESFREMLRETSGEVKTSVRGALHGWIFTRSWVYWDAKGPGIELEAAMKLHEQFGNQVRVAGHCGCPSPLEHYKGLACGSYHIDSPEGLKALADTIRSLVAKAGLEPEHA